MSNQYTFIVKKRCILCGIEIYAEDCSYANKMNR